MHIRLIWFNGLVLQSITFAQCKSRCLTLVRCMKDVTLLCVFQGTRGANNNKLQLSSNARFIPQWCEASDCCLRLCYSLRTHHAISNPSQVFVNLAHLCILRFSGFVLMPASAANEQVVGERRTLSGFLTQILGAYLP